MNLVDVRCYDGNSSPNRFDHVTPDWLVGLIHQSVPICQQSGPASAFLLSTMT